MPSGYVFDRTVRDRALYLVCATGSPTAVAAAVGVSRSILWSWWRDAGGMSLHKGHGGADIAESAQWCASTTGRGQRRLSLDDRFEIHAGVRAGDSYAVIGARIGRDKSVIWREVKRHTSEKGIYHGGIAHARARINARRPKQFKLINNPSLCSKIEKWMDIGWSPKLISLLLYRDHRHDVGMQISHETIYQCLYVQTRGELRKDLAQKLSLKRRSRVSHTARGGKGPGKFNEALKIADRPAQVEDRAVPGNWEGDLIIGANGKSAIGTLVERNTRFTLLLHLPQDHTAESVTKAMIKAMRKLPDHLRQTLTWDRGSEIAGYDQIRMALNMPVYLCDPHAPWQRGTNESTNRLLRFWFEKGTDLSLHTAKDLQRIQNLLNTRPRPTLDLDTPAQRLNQLILTPPENPTVAPTT